MVFASNTVCWHSDRPFEIAIDCELLDVIIVEDDPYYFMQVGEYLAPEFRSTETGDEKEFLGSLVPSFLK